MVKREVYYFLAELKAAAITIVLPTFPGRR
jgi:hypothetical protein